MHGPGGIFFYGIGLALAPFVADNSYLFYCPFLFAIVALSCYRSRLFPLAMALFLVGFGLAQYNLSLRPQPENELIFRAAGQNPVKLEGRIDAIGDRTDNALFLDIAPVWIEHEGAIHTLAGKVRLYVESASEPLAPGDTVILQTRLREPRNFRTPGAFDFRRYLLRRDIVATGFARDTAEIARATGKPGLLQPVIAIKRWRHTLRQLINSELPEEAAPFLKALAIGDRGAMNEAQRKLLSKSGIAHLFAISGLHVGLVATLLYLVLRIPYLRYGIRRLGLPPRRIIPPLILPLLCVYMIMTGSAVSTVRALVMLGGVTVLCMVSRRTRPLDILLAAAFLILVFDPLALFEPSFQLSVAGVGGIILFAPTWQNRIAPLPPVVRYPLSLLAVTLSASLATAPFVLLHFHTLAPAGILFNLAAVPLVSLVLVPLTLLAIMLALFSPPAAIFCFKIIAGILMPFINFIGAALSIEHLDARYFFLTPQAVLLMVLLVIFAATFRQLTTRSRALFAVAILALGFASGFSRDHADTMRVYAFDVGQGDATLLQLPDGRNILVDGGGLFSDTFDTGERLVAPALGHLGVDHLDAVILSHNHPDHRTGLLYVLEHFPVRAFWTTRTRGGADPELLQLARDNNIEIVFFETGWTAVEDNGALSVFVPENNSTKLNDHSLVVYARHGESGLLLTGDLEQEGLAELAANPAPGPVSLLKLPHHGSLKSDPTPLLQTCKPQQAFCSVGFNNRYGLPHPMVITRLQSTATPLSRTDLNGSLRFITSGHNWAITHWKNGLFR